MPNAPPLPATRYPLPATRYPLYSLRMISAGSTRAA